MQKLQKHINTCCCGFNKILIKRKKYLLQEKYDPRINFDLMINFDFFDLITWDSLMVWAWKLVCARLISFEKSRNILTLLTFGCTFITYSKAFPNPALNLYQETAGKTLQTYKWPEFRLHKLQPTRGKWHIQLGQQLNRNESWKYCPDPEKRLQLYWFFRKTDYLEISKRSLLISMDTWRQKFENWAFPKILSCL